jgi:hypothetical protein
MEQTTLFTRLNTFADTLFNTLVGKEPPLTKAPPAKAPTVPHNRPERKEFFYYTRLIDNDTLEIVGHLTDISTGGFKLDSQVPIPINKDIRFLMNLTSEIADKPFMIFAARSKWCKVDPIDPYVYNIGFQLLRIAPDDLKIFNRMIEKYGRELEHRNFDLRRSNKW